MIFGQKNGGITVFLSILFLLFFSMIGVLFESARILSSDGYLRVAARSAAMSVFGNYNKELYEQYGLYGYGGYDGIGTLELDSEFLEALEKNLCAEPEGEEKGYTDFYQFGQLDADVLEGRVLTEQDVFYEQIKGFLKNQAIEDIKDGITGKAPESASSESVKEKLAITKDYEDGKYNPKEDEESDTTGEESTGEDESDEEESDSEQEAEETIKEDAAGGNPLKTFSELAKTGILDLVCDTRTIAEGEVKSRNTDVSLESPDEKTETAGEKVVSKEDLEERTGEESSLEESTEESVEEMGAADYLNEIIGEEAPDINLFELTEKKVLLLLYASKQFADYTNSMEKTTKYGLEYLAFGKEKEKDNLSAAVNRLLVIRMLLNMSYVMKDPVLLEKSSTTAQVLAGFTGLPPVISAVQYTILMILSFQEACIDVTALLEGREVPVLKDVSNFQMKYEEICIGTKSLFQKRAEVYEKGKGETLNQVAYGQYLFMIMVLRGEETIRNRMADLIQYDLRERYNQTFIIDQCICSSTYQISYRTPILFDSLPFLSWEDEVEKLGVRSQEVTYGYKSK